MSTAREMSTGAVTVRDISGGHCYLCSVTPRRRRPLCQTCRGRAVLALAWPDDSRGAFSTLPVLGIGKWHEHACPLCAARVIATHGDRIAAVCVFVNQGPAANGERWEWCATHDRQAYGDACGHYLTTTAGGEA